MTIGLILKIQTLCAWHEAIVRYYLDPDNQEYSKVDTCPTKYVKIHTLCRDELRCIIYDLGVDCHHVQIDPARPLRRPLNLVEKGFGFQGSPRCYGSLLREYQNILSMRPLPAFIETKLFEQVCRLQCFVEELELSKNSIPNPTPKPERPVAPPKRKIMVHS